MTTGSSLPEDKSEDLFLDIAWFSKMNAKWRKIPKYKVVDEINFWLLVWNWLIDKTKCFPVPTYCRLVKNDHQLGNWEIVKLRIRLRVVQANPFSFFDINVGRSRIRHKTTLNFNDFIFKRFWDDRDMSYIKIQIRSMSDPTLSENSKVKWIWSELPLTL